MINIDKIAYSSKLKNQNPIEKVFFALLTLAVCLSANSLPVSIAVVITMALVSVIKGGIRFSVFFKLLLLPMAFLFLGVLAIALEIKNGSQNLLVSIQIFGRFFGVSSTGIGTAANLFFRALGAVSCLYYLSLNTPLTDILLVLQKLRCPKLLIELMHLIYRFIFVLLATAETVFIAQNSRLGYTGLSSGYRSVSSLISTLFFRSYRHSDEIYTAMEARGYDGEINVLEESKPWSRTGFIMSAGFNLLLISAWLALK